MASLTPTQQRITLAFGIITMMVLRQHHYVPEVVDPTAPQMAWSQIGMLVLSIVLSLIAGALLAKDNKATLKDDKPTTLVTRGSFLTWVLGVRRIGPLFSWAGERFTTEEKTGKKGLFGSGPKQKIFHESGWHLLAIGPGFCLHQILDNGKAVFKGPITRTSHPSGTFIDLGTEGGFYIFWGEPTQPINTRLGAAERVGIASRWPYHFYVEWAPKRLGMSPNWSLIDYEVEVRVEDIILTAHNAPHMLPDKLLSGPIESPDTVTFGATDFFTFVGVSISQNYQPKDIIRTQGITGLADQDLTVLFSTTIQVPGPPNPKTGVETFTTDTQVHFVSGDLTGAVVPSGTIQLYKQALNFGINAAHGIAQILFARWPHGLGQPQTGDEAQWDINDGAFSLENLATLMDKNNENLRTSWIAKDGDSVEVVLGTALQDLGVMIPLDPDTGRIQFRPIREPVGTLRRIRNTALVDGLPEIEVVHIDMSPDRVTFSFPDRNLTDRDGTIAVMDDGKIERLELQHARNVQITITTDYVTASIIAQRRSQELLGQGVASTMKGNRATRTLIPGEAITVDALPDVQRVESVKINAETNKVELKIIGDAYGVAKTPFVDIPPPETGQFKAVEPDLLKAILEVPELVLGTDAQTVLIPRIRAHDQVFQATLHLSRDNSTYTAQSIEFGLQTGGLLNSDLSAGGEGSGEDGLYLMENGPEFTALGPDIGIVEDLTLDPINWTLGRQWAIISSDEGEELCFVRNITFVSGTTWRADGLIRARFGTRALAHPAGSKIFIFVTDNIESLQDILLTAQVGLFTKTQPVAGGVLPLDADTPVSTFLYGKGIGLRPDPSSALAVIAPDLVNSYQTGLTNDVTVRWDWPNAQSPSAGAGMQGAGLAVVDPLFAGDFILEIRNLAGTVIERSETLSTNSFTYTNANIVADLGSEISFQMWVYTRRGGLLADPVKITVEAFS